MSPRAFILAGPTAVGKTGVAHRLADRLNLRLLSADSMLVYRGMDIGTAKPSAEERSRYRYLGLDLADPSESFSAGAWLAHAGRALQPAEPVMVTGGTGLYINGLLQGIDAELPAGDPELRHRLEACYRESGIAALRDRLRALDASWFDQFPDPDNPRRLMRAIEILELHGRRPDNWKAGPLPRVAGLRRDRESLGRRIARRVDVMFEEGLLDEIGALIERFPQWSATAAGAIGYAEGRAVLEGRMAENEAREKIAARTRQLAKRQMTWFRNKLEVDWVDVEDGEPDEDVAARVVGLWERTGPAELQLDI